MQLYEITIYFKIIFLSIFIKLTFTICMVVMKFFLSYQQIRFQAFSFALKCILTLQSNAQSSHTKYFKTLANIFMPMTNFHNKQVSSDDMLWQEKVLFVSYNYYYFDIYLYRNNFIENSLNIIYLKVTSSQLLLPVIIIKTSRFTLQISCLFLYLIALQKGYSCDSDTNMC